MLTNRNKFLLVGSKLGEEVASLVVSMGEVVAWPHGDQGSGFWESDHRRWVFSKGEGFPTSVEQYLLIVILLSLFRGLRK